MQVLPEEQRTEEGFRNKASQVRWEKRESVACVDKKDIPADQIITTQDTCASAHLGLCVAREREISAAAFKLGNRLGTHMKAPMKGGYFELTSNREGEHFEAYMPTKIYVAAAWVQGNPKVCFFQILTRMAIGSAVLALVPTWRSPRKF